MEDQKHTPLPWETMVNNRNSSIEVVPPIRETGGRWNSNHCIAEFYGPDREANAALFMSVPGMKAALEYSNGETQHWIGETEKARGRIALQLRAIAEFRIENERFRLQIEMLKTALTCIADLENETRVHFDSADAYQLWETLHKALAAARTELRDMPADIASDPDVIEGWKTMQDGAHGQL